jgi:hypothetical protein
VLLLLRSIIASLRCQPRSGRFDHLVKFLLQDLLWWENGEIFGYVYSCSTQFQQFNLFGVLASTKNNAKRKSFVFLPFVLGEPAQVKLHLTFVLRLEVSLLEL